MLVLLRVAVGWHFLYQGLDKYHDPNFSAAGYLQQAKGPFGPYFRELIPDVDGIEALSMSRAYETPEAPAEENDDKAGDDKAGDEPAVEEDDPSLTDENNLFRTWEEHRERFATHYDLSDEQIAQSKDILEQHAKMVADELNEDQALIELYLRDLENLKAATQSASADVSFQQQRLYDRRKELKDTAEPWLTKIDNGYETYKKDLKTLLTEDQRAMGPLVEWDQMKIMNVVITWSLIIGGACLIAGLFTRLAAWGGVLFLSGVVLSQLDLGNGYPPPHPAAGAQMIVNKEMIEMIALMVLGTAPVGRWAGLDYLGHALWMGLFGSKAGE